MHMPVLARKAAPCASLASGKPEGRSRPQGCGEAPDRRTHRRDPGTRLVPGLAPGRCRRRICPAHHQTRPQGHFLERRTKLLFLRARKNCELGARFAWITRLTKARSTPVRRDHAVMPPARSTARRNERRRSLPAAQVTTFLSFKRFNDLRAWRPMPLEHLIQV